METNELRKLVDSYDSEIKKMRQQIEVMLVIHHALTIELQTQEREEALYG